MVQPDIVEHPGAPECDGEGAEEGGGGEGGPRKRLK